MPAPVSRWREIADLHYARIESMVQREGIEAVQRQLPPGQRFLPHVSSIRLDGVYGAAETQCIIDRLGGAALPRSPDLSSRAHAPEDEADGGAPPPRWRHRQETPLLLEIIEHELGGAVACDLDHAWVRRQYAVHRRPPGHVAHSWHQDGALLYPFDPTGSRAPAAHGLPRMVACWVALTPCGSQAPGLELVRQRLDSLLPPSELIDDQVRTRFPVELFWRPVMEPGDVLLFSGGTLHRTHVDPRMDEDRTSIELRFLPAHAIPKRLAGDRFATLPSSAVGGGKSIGSETTVVPARARVIREP